MEEEEEEEEEGWSLRDSVGQMTTLTESDPIMAEGLSEMSGLCFCWTFYVSKYIVISGL